MIRRGAEVVWRSTSEGSDIATIELPAHGIEPGAYRIEAVIGENSTSAPIVIGKEETKPSGVDLISFNANLAPAQRYAFVGHQWLLRGKLDQARHSLEASLEKGVTPGATVELARTEALSGNLDIARNEVKTILTAQPNNFEALSVYAYIESKFQDYAVAADLYRRALAVQDSPAIRAALAQLPAQ
jgi:tetratricopeptide (TPR) repeat protein